MLENKTIKQTFIVGFSSVFFLIVILVEMFNNSAITLAQGTTLTPSPTITTTLTISPTPSVTPEPTIVPCNLARTTSLAWVSSINNRQTLYLTPENADLDLNLYIAYYKSTAISTNWRVQGSTDYWNLAFASAPRQPLTTSLYSPVTRFPINGNLPGLSISGSNWGCDILSGKFDIKEIRTDANNKLECLKIDFEQFCAYDFISGTLQFNAHPPILTHTVYLPYIIKPSIQCDIAKYSKLEWVSPPTDYIGQGQNLYLDKTNSNLTIIKNTSNLINLKWFVKGSSDYWGTIFRAKRYEILKVGLYDQVVRYPFNDNEPGMDIGGYGRGCNEIRGKFEIQELKKIDNNIMCLAMTFQQSCGGPPLNGTLHINLTNK